MEFSAVTRKDLKALASLAQASVPDFGFLDGQVLEEQSLGDPGYDGSFFLQAVEAKKPVGFILGVTRREGEGRKGYLKFFCVHPKFRGRRFGNDLFSELERRFLKREVREVHAGLCPFPYFWSGVDSRDTATVCFLLSRGYERRGDVVDMSAELSKLSFDLSPEDQSLAKEFRVRRAKPEDWDKSFGLLRGAFPWWQAEIRSGLEKGWVFTAEREGQAVAFAAAGACFPGALGPLGTLEAERKQGLGRILMLKCLEQLKKQGQRRVTIPWVGPIPFYARFAGASISRVGWHFVKRL
jgi:ribosomal protein S18 acetylase RimI-like enzyme